MSKHWGPIVPRMRQGTPAELMAERIVRLGELLIRIGQMEARLQDRRRNAIEYCRRAAADHLARRISRVITRQATVRTMLVATTQEWLTYTGALIAQRDEAESKHEMMPF